MTLGEILSDLDRLDPELVIYLDVPSDQWAADTNAVLLSEEEGSWAPPTGWTYFLEIFTALEVVEGWTKYRDRALTAGEVIEVVIYYARWDAFGFPDD